jgi:hypothetical protein
MTQANAGRWRIGGVSAQIPVLGATINSAPRSDQENNLFWLADFALKALAHKTAIFGEGIPHEERPYVHVKAAPLTWAVLPVAAGTSGPVAWMYAKWRDSRAGMTLLGMCGSLENYVNIRPGTRDSVPSAWYPSTPQGLAGIMSAMADGREDEVRLDMTSDGPNLLAVANMTNTLTALPRPHVGGSLYAELLMEEFVFARNIRIAGKDGGERIDTFILGAPLWVRSTAPVPMSSGSLPPDFESALEEDQVRHLAGLQERLMDLRVRLANWIMPPRTYLYADAEIMPFEEIIMRPALSGSDQTDDES